MNEGNEKTRGDNWRTPSTKIAWQMEGTENEAIIISPHGSKDHLMRREGKGGGG